MIKRVHSEVFAFDAEWVPDPVTGRAVYNLPGEMPDSEVINQMRREGGATPEEPRPYIKTVLCRVVSIAVMIRVKNNRDPLALTLYSLPRPEKMSITEPELLERFLGRLGKSKPQLVGFNSLGADLPIMIQRAVVHGLSVPEFCERPEKPWEGVDYFAKGSDFNIDLKDELGTWGKGTPSLHEIAAASGIPGKIGVSGGDVLELWTAGEIKKIVEYNEWDAITTYLLWLRLAHLAGFVSTEGFEAEQATLEKMLTRMAGEPGGSHLGTYLEQWKLMSAKVKFSKG
jgi:predicted PolB exonuclease-like 3'-5' exonuclease